MRSTPTARRNGAAVVAVEPEGPIEGSVLITDDAAGAAWLARDLGATAAFYLPRTPNGRGVADAWSAAADGEPGDGEPTVLIVSGDEAANDPNVRALAAHAAHVIGIGMFEASFRGLADLVLPGTSYLERDGTTVNLEGRLQRQRRAVIAPCPDELAWIAKLAARFGVTLSPHASIVFDEVAARCYGGISFGDITEHAPLPAPAGAAPAVAAPRAKEVAEGPGLRLLTYRPLFSGPAVERTPALAFQRRDGEVELTRADAQARRIADGDVVRVTSNGTSVMLRARLTRELPEGAVRIPVADAAGLHELVEVSR